VFSSDHVVDRIAKKGSKTILHRGTYRKHKHSEGNKTYRKSKQSEGNSYSLGSDNRWAATLVNILGWLKSEKTCTQAYMLVAFPLTTARDKCWWKHCHSLGSADISTSFFARQFKKGEADLLYAPLVSIATC